MTILYIFIAFLGGWFVGFLDSNLRTAKKIQAAETAAEQKIEEARLKVSLAERNFAEANPQQDDPGLLRLKRKDGRYLLELDGTPAPSELSHEMRKRLIELITIFRLWLDPAQSSPAPMPTPPQPVVAAQVTAPPPVVAPLKKAEPEKNIKALSIVQQIDMVLQERLANTPLDRRGIRLQESDLGGVEVYVGLQKFDAVDDVPDLEIKSAIRAAIADWEKKYTPGM
jgi:hypothetical protein